MCIRRSSRSSRRSMLALVCTWAKVGTEGGGKPLPSTLSRSFEGRRRGEQGSRSSYN
jgi:hypothetical protein